MLDADPMDAIVQRFADSTARALGEFYGDPDALLRAAGFDAEPDAPTAPPVEPTEDWEARRSRRRREEDTTPPLVHVGSEILVMIDNERFARIRLTSLKWHEIQGWTATIDGPERYELSP